MSYQTQTKTLKKATGMLPKAGELPADWVKRISSRLHLLSLNNAKLAKALGESSNWADSVDTIDAALMLAPHSLSGRNVCPDSTPACREVCVAYSGNGRFPNVLQARVNRTQRFFDQRGRFGRELGEDMRLLATVANLMGAKLALRLNAFSDLAWERIKLYADGSTAVDVASAMGIQLYDYTKSKRRALRMVDDARYDLTYSRDESTPDAEVVAMVEAGANVAVPFHPVPPALWLGLTVADGDATDQRYLDPKGVVVGLKAKGIGRSDQSGFVVRVA